MAEAAPEDGVERYLRRAAKSASADVNAWNERHSDPKYVTDLWLVITDRDGTRTRVPACRAVLIMIEDSTFRFTVTCGNTSARGLSLSTQRTLLEVNKFLLDFYKKARATINAKDAAISTLKDRTLGSCIEEEIVKRPRA